MKISFLPSILVSAPLLLPGLALAQEKAADKTPAPGSTPTEQGAATPPEAPPTTAPEAPAVGATAEVEASPAPAPSSPEPLPTPLLDAAPQAPGAPLAPVDAPAPAAPPEPSLGPIKFGTNMWSRYEVREGYDRLGVSLPARARFQEGDQMVFRARLKMETSPLELLPGVTGMVNFTPQASGLYGTSGLGGTIGEANLGIYEGFFKVSTGKFDFRLGRMAMNYGDAMVIGNLDWHQSGRAFDGVHTHLALEKGFIDVFATQVAEGWPALNTPLAAGDTYFWGVYSNFGGYLAKDLNLEPYVLGLSTAKTSNLVFTDAATGGTTSYTREGATLFTLGARIQHKLEVIDYRLEGGVQLGDTATTVTVPGDTLAESVSTVAFHVDGEVGVSPSKKARIALGGLYASGNTGDGSQIEAWNELYPTGHKFFGYMDLIGTRSNLAGGMLKANVGLTDSLNLNLEAHVFARPEAGGLGRVAGSSDGYAGTLLNGQLTQKIGKFVSARGLYAIYIPNGAHYAVSDPAHYLELQGGLNF